MDATTASKPEGKAETLTFKQELSFYISISKWGCLFI
jgi:hypothetical protein